MGAWGLRGSIDRSLLDATVNYRNLPAAAYWQLLKAELLKLGNTHARRRLSCLDSVNRHLHLLALIQLT